MDFQPWQGEPDLGKLPSNEQFVELGTEHLMHKTKEELVALFAELDSKANSGLIDSIVAATEFFTGFSELLTAAK
jgi:hypothetical protein